MTSVPAGHIILTPTSAGSGRSQRESRVARSTDWATAPSATWREREHNKAQGSYTKPGLQSENKRANHKYKKNSYDVLPLLSWTQYNQTVRQRYILFVFTVYSGFFSACSPGLVYLRPNTEAWATDRESEKGVQSELLTIIYMISSNHCLGPSNKS